MIKITIPWENFQNVAQKIRIYMESDTYLKLNRELRIQENQEGWCPQSRVLDSRRLYTERTLEICRVFYVVSSKSLIITWTLGKYPRQGKGPWNDLRELEETVHSAHRSQQIVLVPKNRSGKFTMYWVEYSQVLYLIAWEWDESRGGMISCT